MFNSVLVMAFVFIRFNVFIRTNVFICVYIYVFIYRCTDVLTDLFWHYTDLIKMLKCYICGGDASCSSTMCFTCKRFIDINCHGCCTADGYVVCTLCTGMHLYYIEV